MLIIVKEPYQPEYQITDSDLSIKVSSGDININETVVWQEGLADWISLKLYLAETMPLPPSPPPLPPMECPPLGASLGRKSVSEISSALKQNISSSEPKHTGFINRLNVWQKAVLISCAVILFGMIVFPPFKASYPVHHTIYNMGYGFILNPPSLLQGQRSTAFIDIGTLLIQAIAVIILAGLAFVISGYLGAKSTRQRQSVSSLPEPTMYTTTKMQAAPRPKGSYSGINRLQYAGYFAVIVLLFPLFSLLLHIAPDNGFGALLSLFVGIGWILLPFSPIIPSYYRLKNIGANPWECLLCFIPIVNFIIYARCFIYQERYVDSKKLDSAGRRGLIIFFGVVGVIALFLVIALTARSFR